MVSGSCGPGSLPLSGLRQECVMGYVPDSCRIVGCVKSTAHMQPGLLEEEDFSIWDRTSSWD
ncbi:hypothetical protein [Pseudomonas phage PIP]|nr:hypothetical protein [Pseudomonas phage PIP]